jgi:hypothetical protein
MHEHYLEEDAEALDTVEARGSIERRWDGQKRKFRMAASEG